jgi:two-component system chemotaxis response regulator CheB
MAKKILIVDDSALMRRVMSDIIEEDEQLTVAETAKNGENAIDLLRQGKRYDIILLDLKMPKMNGVQFLREMQKSRINIPVLIVSSVASKSAKETIEALELGAFDFVKKPSERVGDAFMEFRYYLLMHVYQACGLKIESTEFEPPSETKKAALPKPEPRKAPNRNVPVRKGDKLFVIASSTGGPKALQSVIPLFPIGFPYPIVVIQHMPAGFTASLAARLNDLSPLNVKEAEDGEVLVKGNVYIAQGGKQCELVQNQLGKYAFSENDKPARGGLRPCADIFFESLVDTSLDEVICGVLTGMGADASKGILQVRDCKTVKTVAQNQDTCVVYGMPRAAKMAGVVDDMVPLEDVAGTMMKIGV